MNDTVAEFQGEYRFLSNFYISSIVYEGMLYPTVEHAFQAAKSLDREERWNVVEQPSPGDAKRVGRALRLRPDWEEVKEQVMYDLLKLKFADPFLRELLLDTGEAYLEEGNTWHDRYWGVCDGSGKNRLGHLLMDLRSVLALA